MSPQATFSPGLTDSMAVL